VVLDPLTYKEQRMKPYDLNGLEWEL
jgi:hypothetical protein